MTSEQAEELITNITALHLTLIEMKQWIELVIPLFIGVLIGLVAFHVFSLVSGRW